MSLDETVYFMVLTFGIQPSEAWKMTPADLSICWKLYKRMNIGEVKKEPYTKGDLKRLELKIGRTRRIKS